MSVKTVRRIAAKVLKVGESRVKIKPDEVKRAAEALTADDVRGLVREGVVWADRVKGVPRIRAKVAHKKKKKGRRSGGGSKRGSKYSKTSQKELWKVKTRLQRSTLKDLRQKGKLSEGVYRRAYRMIKGNSWRSRAAMLAHFEDAKWFKQPGKQKAPSGEPAAVGKK